MVVFLYGLLDLSTPVIPVLSLRGDYSICQFAVLRILVYEYVDNGNLEQWIHGDVGPCSPLTWEIRMNIILGTAKGYTTANVFVNFLFLSINCFSILC